MLVRFFSILQRRSEWLALFFLTTSFFVSQISVSLTSVAYTGAFLFAMLAGQWQDRWDRIKQNPGILSFWLLFSLFILGIFYSTSSGHQIFHDLQKRHWMLMTPILMSVIRDERWRQRMVNVFLGVMLITLILGFAKWVFNFDLLAQFTSHGTGDRANPFMDHIVQSVAMSIAAFICLYRFLFLKKNRVFYIIIFLLMAFNIMCLSTGRTGYAVFCLMLFYIGIIRFGWKGVIVAALLGTMMLTSSYLVSTNFRTRIQAMVQHYEHYDQLKVITSIGQRVEMMSIAKKMIVRRHWFGYGTGGIRAQLPIVVPANERIFNPSINYVESIYLNFMLEFGVFGLIVFFIAMGMQIKMTFALPHEYRCLMQVVLASILFGGLFNMFFASFPIMHLYSLFAALCFSAKLSLPQPVRQ